MRTRTTTTESSDELARRYSHDPVTGSVTQEQIAVGDFEYVLVRTNDSLGRPSGVELAVTGQSPFYSVSYSYDTTGRLASVTWTNAGQPQFTAAYSYVPDSALIASVTISGGTTTLSSARTYEPNRDLIVSVSNLWGAAAVSDFVYGPGVTSRQSTVLV